MTYFKIEGFSKYLLGKGDGENEWKVVEIKEDGSLEDRPMYLNNEHIICNIKNDKGKWCSMGLHVLIARVLIPIPQELLDNEELLHVHHKDGNPQNNVETNLIWLAESEHHKLHKKGENNPMYGKSRPEGSGKPPKKVYQLSLDGELVAVWSSTAECRRNGFHQGNVAACCRGERNIHRGFKWSYEAPL